LAQQHLYRYVETLFAFATMGSTDDESYGFEVQWHDPQADILRKYQLTAFVPARVDGSMEVAMYDPKNKRQFLKRVPAPELNIADFHKGGSVMVASRQLTITGFLDQRTEMALQQHRSTFAVKTSTGAFHQLGRIVSCIEEQGLSIGKLRLVNDNGPVVAIEVFGKDVGSKWYGALNRLPDGLAKDVSPEEAAPCFDKACFPTTAAFDNCTLCIIRPHALRAGNAGKIITAIQDDGFEISAAQTLHLKRPEAEELLEVYKGVLPYYTDLVEVMTSGPCLALELRSEKDVVERFRSLCGPYDVDMAKHLRPNSLRARFGLDNPKNAVHSTDLENDAEREVQYVFETLN